MLEATGASLTIVDEGLAALDALRIGAFDMVLMDINMPVMDGVTALAAIRAGEAGDPAMPVIALTASAMAGDRERFLAMGFDDHLGKPIRPVELLSAIGAAARSRIQGAQIARISRQKPCHPGQTPAKAGVTPPTPSSRPGPGPRPRRR
jgi:CheY-like chemotaxis protein